MKIIAVDPGYERIGIAVLKRAGSGSLLLHSECFKTPAKLPFPERLLAIGTHFEQLIQRFKPQLLAAETLYFGTNRKTAMRVAEARGVIIYTAQKAALAVEWFTPLQIKIAVAGFGRADKKQIISMVPKLIKIKRAIKHDDEYDAVAVGLTYFACQKSAVREPTPNISRQVPLLPLQRKRLLL